MANPVKDIIAQCLRACGLIGNEQELRRLTRTFLDTLDQKGFVVMPKEATSELIQASLAVMRTHERDIPDEYGKQRAKQVLRYSAMVERQRLNLLPLSDLPGETSGGTSDKHALDRAINRAAARVFHNLPRKK